MRSFTPAIDLLERRLREFRARVNKALAIAQTENFIEMDVNTRVDAIDALMQRLGLDCAMEGIFHQRDLPQVLNSIWIRTKPDRTLEVIFNPPIIIEAIMRAIHGDTK